MSQGDVGKKWFYGYDYEQSGDVYTVRVNSRAEADELKERLMKMKVVFYSKHNVYGYDKFGFPMQAWTFSINSIANIGQG